MRLVSQASSIVIDLNGSRAIFMKFQKRLLKVVGRVSVPSGSSVSSGHFAATSDNCDVSRFRATSMVPGPLASEPKTCYGWILNDEYVRSLFRLSCVHVPDDPTRCRPICILRGIWYMRHKLNVNRRTTIYKVPSPGTDEI